MNTASVSDETQTSKINATHEVQVMDGVPTNDCASIVSDLQARQDVRASLYDRVSVVPDRLDYALIPSSLYARLGLSGSCDSPVKRAVSHSAVTITEQQDAEQDTIYISVDDNLVYARFFADFGPLDLAQTVRFCRTIEHHLTTSSKVLLISSDHQHKRANVMALLALYLVVIRKKTPSQAIAPFETLRPAQGFRDAGCGLCTFSITVFDCASAVHKAIRESIFDYNTFKLEEYEHYDKLHHGDINWIVPGKILAFSGPQRERVFLDGNGRTTLLAHEYAKVFTTLGVSCVVRFNEPTTYDRRAFIQANIRHLDMHYPDGGNPTDEIMLKFVRTCERESGAVAVHCKAGLGRTGTNIAAYLMKNHHFTAAEAMAWCRICRPGSIVGPQQQFLIVKQPLLWKLAVDEEEEQKQQQAKSAVKHSSGTEAVPVKKQSFAAMRERLPPANAADAVNLSTKRSFRRGSSVSSVDALVVAKTASQSPSRQR